MVWLAKLILKAESDLVAKACKEYINIGISCNPIVLQSKSGGCISFSWRTSEMRGRNLASTDIKWPVAVWVNFPVLLLTLQGVGGVGEQIPTIPKM